MLATTLQRARDAAHRENEHADTYPPESQGNTHGIGTSEEKIGVK